jgi:hypothetical protein
MAWLSWEVDFTFDIIQTIMFVLFSLEIIFTALAKRNYILSFFFWLDIGSTLSLIQDISFIFNPLINLAYGYIIVNYRQGDDKSNNPNVNFAFLRVSRASRATRLLRIIKIIRLLRIVKLYKNAVMVRENREIRISEKERNFTINSDNIKRDNTNQSATNNNLLNITNSPTSKIY